MVVVFTLVIKNMCKIIQFLGDTQQPQRVSIGFIRKKVFSLIKWGTKRIEGEYDRDHWSVSVEKKEFDTWCVRNEVPTKLPWREVGDVGVALLIIATERVGAEEIA